MTRGYKRIFRPVILPLTALLMLTACLPTSENPVLVDGEPLSDPALAGAWGGVMDDASDPVILYFIKTNESRADKYPGGQDLIMINDPLNEEGPQDWAELYALSTRIADRNFLSIEYRGDNGENITGSERGFHLFMYQITDDDHLNVAGVDEDILTEMVEEGKIAGSISDSKWFPDVRLTASSSELAAFLASVDVDSLFSQPLGPFSRAAPN